MKFIHAADLHIDSPLRGLQQYEGAPAQRLREATRDAFDHLVTMGIEQDVDFVVIAGDLFDGRWQDMQTGIWTANQFRRLEREDIAVYLLRGNHDAASRVEQSIRWPANVHEFPTNRPGTFLREDLGVALHGQGFAHREMPDDLVPGYPEPVAGLFNIGVLHTSLTGDPNHDTYAPTGEDVLVGRGYDYWALGHIHGQRTVRQRPFIAYPGNTQGRNIRESGAKGCFLVSVEDGEMESVNFHETDTLRWHQVEVDLTVQDGPDELLDRVRRKMLECQDQNDGRLCAIRLRVRGPCAAHRALAHPAERERITAEIRSLANDFDGDVWVEKVRLETAPLVNLDQLRRGTDLVGDLLRQAQQAEADEDQLFRLSQELKALSDKAAIELKDAGIDVEDPDQLREWLREAEGLLISHLLESHA